MNASLQNGNVLESPPDRKSYPTLTGTSHGAVHVALSHSEQRESHDAASSADRGQKAVATHLASGDGSTGLAGKDSLTLSHRTS